ncbi:MAG: ABC transporter permease [Hyphomicrobiales bacterium]|nr:MAG: ABC transporter permease [Hyphomicrobiales bacterium]
MLELISFGPTGWGDEILSGAWITLSLAVATLPLGLIFGFFLAMAKNSDEPSLANAANVYTTIFRGLPELLTLFIVFYGLPLVIRQIEGLFTDDPSIQINSFVAGMIALGAVFSSYASEVFVSAFKGIPEGQYEGAYALGMRKSHTMRQVIFPQLIRLALPGLSNLWLILLKETALVSVIGLSDILRQTTIASRVTKEPFMFFGVACLLYLVFSIASSVGIGAIERWTNRGEVR